MQTLEKGNFHVVVIGVSESEDNLGSNIISNLVNFDGLVKSYDPSCRT